jgi:hypothetical protein
MIRWMAVLLVLPLWLLAGCQETVAVQCDEETPCQGFGEVCQEGQCVVGSCTSNLDCPMEQTCNGRTCRPGCDSSNDCYPGDVCNLAEGMCEPEGCRDTHLDCGYKEFCNTATGECYEAGGPYCRPCSSRNVIEDCNGGDAAGTNQCWNNYCTVDCSNGRECPSGFQCFPFQNAQGEVVTFQCLTYCWLYEEQAAVGEPVPAPPLRPLPLDPVHPQSLLPRPGDTP